MNVLKSALYDAQTTVTSLGAGIGGATSTYIGNQLVALVGPVGNANLGTVGLEFCARSVVSAAVFGALTSLMPETSQNVFFSILYFAADTGLVSTALAVSNQVVRAVTNLVPMPRQKLQRAPKQPTLVGEMINDTTRSCNTGACFA